MIRYEAFEDRKEPGIWRVEVIGHEGDRECVATFTGADPETQAIEYVEWKNAGAVTLTPRVISFLGGGVILGSVVVQLLMKAISYR